MLQTVEEMSATLDGFAKLEPNWDSYGAAAPHARAIERAKIFAAELAPAIQFVCPTVNGQIQFEFGDAVTVRIGESSADDELWIDDEEVE